MKLEKNPWTCLHSKEVYQNNWIKVHHQDVIDPSGKEGIYGIVEFKSLAAGIIPLDQHYNTWIVGQYRYPLKKYSWEIPEGGVHFDKPLEGAKRELLEETGISANQWTAILDMDLSNSATTETAKIYVAQELSFSEATPESTEQLLIKKIPFKELFQMVISGQCTDSLTVAGVLKLQYLLSINEF